jgi:sterol 3beta-glucosyltransferase
MRVLIYTIGSEGDVQPYLALAKRLLAAGHDATLATNERCATRAAAVGVPFTPVGLPFDEAQLEPLYARLLAKTPATFPTPDKNLLQQLTFIIEALEQEQRAAVPQLMALARESDVVVYSSLCVAAAAAARAVGTPHVSVHHSWPVHRARGYSPANVDLGRLGNALAWSLAGWMIRRATDERLNTIVAAAGLPPWRDILLDASHSRLLDLLPVSPLVLPHDPLLGPACRTTGYWFLEEPEFVPPDDLAAFVADEPPVVIGFGSMTGFDARATTMRLLEAVRGLGRRVILQSGWAGLAATQLPPNILVTGFVPHGWLYARAACVVHHGGAGTTAAVFRAGIPQAVVWHQTGQFEWGRKVVQLGVGPPSCAYHALSAGWLRRTIDRLLADDGMTTRARALGAAIRSEDGTGVAVHAIEAAVTKAGRRHS